MDARPTAAERQVCDPESGRRAPLAGPPRATADRAALARRLKLPDDDFEPAEGLFHPRFFVYRRRTAAGSDLYVLGRGTTAQPRRIAAVPSLTQPLVASWGATSGR